MSSWFADHQRKVHILYVSPDWAKRRGERFDARRIADSLAEARVDCVQFYCKDHHGICYYPCSTGLPYEFDVIGPMVEACHEVRRHESKPASHRPSPLARAFSRASGLTSKTR